MSRFQKTTTVTPAYFLYEILTGICLAVSSSRNKNLRPSCFWATMFHVMPPSLNGLLGERERTKFKSSCFCLKNTSKQVFGQKLPPTKVALFPYKICFYFLSKKYLCSLSLEIRFIRNNSPSVVSLSSNSISKWAHICCTAVSVIKLFCEEIYNYPKMKKYN